ncbi:MAG: HAD family hydrolase, partial [Patescibacteria group bacterium]
MPPKITIFDLDGTLTESKQPMTLKMGEVLKKLLDKMPVAVMSGADLPQFEKQFLPYLPQESNLQNLFLFPTSAAECLSFKKDRWVIEYDHLFRGDEKIRIYHALDRALEKTHLVDDIPAFGERIEDRGEQITFSALGQDAPLALKKAWDPDQSKREIIVSKLEKTIPD